MADIQTSKTIFESSNDEDSNEKKSKNQYTNIIISVLVVIVIILILRSNKEKFLQRPVNTGVSSDWSLDKELQKLINKQEKLIQEINIASSESAY